MEVRWLIFRFKSLELLEKCAPSFRFCESESSAETSDGPKGMKLCIQQEERLANEIWSCLLECVPLLQVNCSQASASK